ncbi:cuticle protein 19-like [Anabrus simplex]|uniref:cuticle protein 19-like n=1 Tax=Anabrus simplex TaxID=316456 RepID=UPI0035A3CD95
MRQLLVLSAVATLAVVVSAQYGHSGGNNYGGGHAESFIHFVGPVIGHAQPIHGVVKDKHGHEEHIVDYVAYPHYEYKYGVADHHTGDFHGQQESRDGHKVVGEYSLKEKSGNVRTVKYVADKDGFRAEVHNSHHNTHPQGYSSQGGHGYGSLGASSGYSQGGLGYGSSGASSGYTQGGLGYGSSGASSGYSQGGLQSYGVSGYSLGGY